MSVPALEQEVTAASDQPLLSLRGIQKSFGAVHVLRGVDLDVRPGQVTALVGDNGAGKSTLIKGIAGIHAFDEGEYFFDGQPVKVHGPKDANAARHRGRLPGPRAVRQPGRRRQHVPRPRARAVGPRWTRPRWSCGPARRSTGCRCAPCSRSAPTVASLSGGQRQTVAIARAVLWNSKVVILDEPTAALGVAQTEQVLLLVRRLADRGLGVVLISHNLNDVFEVADDIAVLYLGQLVAQVRREDVTRGEVVELITTGTSEKRNGGTDNTNGELR